VARYFTIEEATTMLPRVRVLVTDIQRLRMHLAEAETQLVAWRIKLRSNGHTMHSELSDLQVDISRTTAEITELLAEAEAMGVIVRDPDVGLVDFPALRSGQEVYLCWRVDEDTLAWWHEIDDGFAGRRPITDF